jgi:hypothetical protein
MTRDDAPFSRRTDLYHGLFHLHVSASGQAAVVPQPTDSSRIPCPTTGRPLRVATIDAGAAAICPRCSVHGRGGFVSFVGDLRLAYACPACREFIWLDGL